MDYAIKDACNVRLMRKSDSKVVLYSDYANSTNLSFTSDRIFAKAKGVNKIAFDYNRQGTFKCEFEVFELAWLSVLLGSDFTSETKELVKREVLTVSATNTVTLASTPKTGSLAIFTLDRDLRTHLKEQTVGTPATTENTYSIATATVTFNSTSCPENTKVVAYYFVDSTTPAKTISVTSNNFPINYIIYGETEVQNTFGEMEYVQLKICNCKPKSSLEIAFATDSVTKLTAEFDLFPDENNEMAEFTIIE